MTCLIVEDQPPAQRLLKKYIGDYGSLELLGVFTDALQAAEFMRTQAVDLLFLDIHLPRISGLDFLKSLKDPPHVILTTAFAEYALEGYEYNVVDYLLKPYSFQRFVQALSKVPARDQAPTSESGRPAPSEDIFIKSGYEHIRLNLKDVLFIQSDADYTEIHLPGRKHLSAEGLAHWEKTLDPAHFARVHKSYIINVRQLQKLAGNQLHLGDGRTIPLGRAFRENFIRNYIQGEKD